MVDNGLIFETLPEGGVPETFTRIDKVARSCNDMTREVLATELYKDLATEYKDGTFAEKMQSLQVETGEKMLAAVDAYIEWKAKYPDITLYKSQDPVSRGEDASINDVVLFLIDNIVKKTKVTDRYDVMSHVCEILECRFGNGAKLEYNLNKLNLRTTKDVLHAVDIYFIMKKLYPDTVFGRQRMHTVWDKSFNMCLPGTSDGVMAS